MMAARKHKPKYLLRRQGRYWARVTVPQELRSIVGRTDLRVPLGADLKIAERRLHASVASIFAILDRARRQVRPSAPVIPLRATPECDLSHDELAREFYQLEVDLDQRIRNFTFDDGEPLLSAGDPALFRPQHKSVLQRVASGRASTRETRELIGWAVEHFRDQGKTSVAKGSEEWTALCRLLAAAQLEAIQRAEERDRSGLAKEPEHPLFKGGGSAADSRVGLADVVAGYFTELKAAGRGKKAQLRWRPVFRRLEEFLGHDRVQRITRNDLLRWKDDLLQHFSPKTVKDTYLAATGAVFQWAVDNGKMAQNPAAGIKIRVSATNRERERGFTDAEAEMVLHAALTYKPHKYAGKHTREAAEMTAAKRWIPLLAAYTGARISELTQLRKADVREEQGIKYLRLSKTQWAEADALWELGDATLPELADRFGVSTRTLQAHFEKGGVVKGSKGRAIAAEIKAEVFARAHADKKDVARLASETHHRAFVNASAVEDLLIEQLHRAASSPAEAYRTATAVKTLSLAAQALERLYGLKCSSLGIDKDPRQGEELPEIVIRDITAEEIAAMRKAQEAEDEWVEEDPEDDEIISEGDELD